MRMSRPADLFKSRAAAAWRAKTTWSEEIPRLALERAAELLQGSERHVLTRTFKSIERRLTDAEDASHRRLCEASLVSRLPKGFSQQASGVHRSTLAEVVMHM